MKDYFKKIKYTSIASALLYLLFGVALIAWPQTTKITLISFFGALIILFGIIGIINYFVYGYEPFGFIFGVLKIIFGITIISCANILSSPEIIAFVFGVCFIFSGLNKTQNSFDYRRAGAKNWWIYTVLGIVIFALGIAALINPFASDKILLTFLGISIIVDSVIQIIDVFIISNKVKKVKHKLSDMFKKETDKKDYIDITPKNEQ